MKIYPIILLISMIMGIALGTMVQYVWRFEYDALMAYVSILMALVFFIFVKNKNDQEAFEKSIKKEDG